MINIKAGDKVFRFGEFGTVDEVGTEDLKTSFMNGATEVILANPTGGVVITWNEQGENHRQRYSFAQIEQLNIKVLGAAPLPQAKSKV